MPNVPIYQYFDKKNMDLMVSLCNQYGTKFTYRKNEEIQCFGDSTNNICVVSSGIIKYSVIDDAGNEYVEEFKTAGQLFGDFPADRNSNRSHPVTVIITACSRAEIQKINLKQLFAILPLEKVTEIKDAISKITEEILSYYMDQAQERSVIPAEVRYQWLKEQQPEVVRHATAKDIASFLRISTEQLRRIKLKHAKNLNT